jgi:hypothetical protein
MSTLTSIKEVLDRLMEDAFIAAPLVPKKVTTYGGPRDLFTKIVETYTLDDEGILHIDRAIQYKMPISYINVDFKIEDAKVEEEQG